MEQIKVRLNVPVYVMAENYEEGKIAAARLVRQILLKEKHQPRCEAIVDDLTPGTQVLMHKLGGGVQPRKKVDPSLPEMQWAEPE